MTTSSPSTKVAFGSCYPGLRWICYSYSIGSSAVSVRLHFDQKELKLGRRIIIRAYRAWESGVGGRFALALEFVTRLEDHIKRRVLPLLDAHMEPERAGAKVVRTYPAEHDLGYKGTSAQKVAKLTSRQRHPSNEMCFGKLTRGAALSRTSLKTLFKEWDDFNGVLTRETLFFTYNEAAAAERNELEYPRSKKPFRSYALLGDDIVISDERVALRLCGAGYRVRSRLAKPSKKQKDGKGCLIVEKVLSRMKPKQLELVPDEYLLMISPPIVHTSWRSPLDKKNELSISGLLWECWDMGEDYEFTNFIERLPQASWRRVFEHCSVVSIKTMLDQSVIGELRSSSLIKSAFSSIEPLYLPWFSSIEPLYLPWISRVPLNKGFSWVPTWKSIPNDDGQFAGRKAVPKILTNMRSFAFDIRVIHGFQDGVFSPAVDLKDGPWTASILHGRPMVLRILCGTGIR
ncbi:hypothetical protein ZIOFF_047649 [Zingiber officinale]|uniref:Uncharacterized protein n=1 Tax=Zingiber officinale TaxID=94328 RepID=A0A8J5FRU2_ZINOF|nr:hypothetical protein ZIOFF_047649 [Zingiber officinale]